MRRSCVSILWLMPSTSFRSSPKRSVDWTPAKMPLLLDGIARAAAKLGRTPVPPATLLGVAALDVPEHLVEVEATAVID